MKRLLLLSLFLLFVSAPLRADEFYGVKNLLIQAIDSPDGTARGTVVGPLSDFFRSVTGSSSPVEAIVTTVNSFKQEGCKRLNLRLKQANVPTKDGKTTDFHIDYGINLCRDGSPPTEGMDLEQIGNALQRKQITSPPPR